MFMGAKEDVTKLVDKHLFVISPNNSGSTFVSRALAYCAHTWSLPREGQHMLGYAGPDTIQRGISLTWASSRENIEFIQDSRHYDWRKTTRAWYFQSQATSKRATIFLVKSPPFLLIADQLAAHFKRPHFVFLVRNPYAVVEGICRRLDSAESPRAHNLELAAKHIISCLQYQRNNILRHQRNSVLIRYEGLCADPSAAKKAITELIPELDDLEFNQRIAVKGIYNEVLRNMNQDQIARLNQKDYGAINRVFEPKLSLLAFFGYELMSRGDDSKRNC